MAFSNSSQDVSLLEALNSFLENLPPQQQSDIRKCSPWEGMVSVCENRQLRKEFVRTLSLSQGNSLRLLLLWKSNTLALPTPVADMLFWDPDQRIDLSFHRLFYYEMGEVQYDPRDTARALFAVRKRAVELYAYLRLLKAYISAYLKIEESPNNAASSDYVPLEQAIQEDLGGRALSSSVGLSTRGENEEQIELPVYLWNTWDGRTVETKRLSEKLPGYAAISHTWGRW